MNLIWRLSKFLLKSFILLVFLAALIIGFSFVEQGELAKSISREIGLPFYTDNEIQIEQIEAPDGYKHINRLVNTLYTVQESGKRIYLHTDVLGDVVGKEVRLDKKTNVAGSILAEELVVIDGGTINKDVKAKKVIVMGDEDHAEQGEGVIYGSVQGEDIKIGSKGLVYGDVGGYESQIDVAGIIQGQLKGEQIILRESAVVYGDVYTIAETIVMSPGAEVRGRIISADNKPLRIIKGEVNDKYNSIKKNLPDGQQNREVVYVNQDNNEFSNMLFSWIPFLIGLISLILLAQTFLKPDTEQAVENIMQTPWRSLWKGIVTILLSIPVTFLLSVSIIGIPIAIGIWVTILVASIVGVSGLAIWVGERVAQTFGVAKDSKLKAAILGTVLLSHIIWVPIFGWLVAAILFLMGLGSVSVFWWPRFKASWRAWRVKGKDE